MKCPTCPDTTLVMTERQGIEIDYCPQCRGVWLDRGELDKLLALADGIAARRDGSREQHEDWVDTGHHGARNNVPGRRKSWLEDLFD